MGVLTEELILSKSMAGLSLDKITKLNFWGKHLCDISICEKMPNLEIVSLSLNSITSLRSLRKCHKLHELYLRRNQISDIGEIVYLRGLKKLHVLWLMDNPCSKIDGYRSIVLKCLPYLTKLDNKDVTSDDIETAMVEGRELVSQLSQSQSNDSPRSNVSLSRSNSNSSRNSHNSPRSNSSGGKLRSSNNGDSLKESPYYRDQNEVIDLDSEKSKIGNSYAKPIDTESQAINGVKSTGEDANTVINYVQCVPRSTVDESGDRAILNSDPKHIDDTASEDNVSDNYEETETQSPRSSGIYKRYKETNKIRSKVGMNPVELSQFSPKKSISPDTSYRRNNVLQAIVMLLEELDSEAMHLLQDEIQKKLVGM